MKSYASRLLVFRVIILKPLLSTASLNFSQAQLIEAIILKSSKYLKKFQACGALECSKIGFVQANSKA
jgi:hypothetical protein